MVEQGRLEHDRPATGRRWPWVVVSVLVLVPLVRMLVLVLDAPKLQYNDYWPMLDSMLTADGGFDPGGVFEFRNEHPVVVAKILYWVNLQVSGGSNVTLGLAVLAVVAIQLVLVHALARPLADRWRLAPMIMVVVAASLLFARQGSWHFIKAMSGAAWLTVNLFALGALVAQVRGHRWLAIGLGLVASLSYGTGLTIWPALLVVAFLLGDRWTRLVPTAAVGAITVVWYQTQFEQVERDLVGRPPPVKAVKQTAEVLGSLLLPAEQDGAVRLGLVLLTAGAVAVVLVVLRRIQGARRPAIVAAPWVGVLLYAFASAALVGGARDNYLVSLRESRYAALGALSWIALLGLVLALVPAGALRRPATRALLGAGAAALFVLALLGGAGQVRALERSRASQDLLSVAFETDLASGSALWLGGLEQLPDGIEGRMQAAGQDVYGSPQLDCGRIGTSLTADEVADSPPAGLTADVGEVGPAVLVRGASDVEGWVEGGDVDCVVITDEQGLVVGAAGWGAVEEGYADVGTEPVAGRVWFRGLFPTTDGPMVFVRLAGDDRFVAL